MVYKVIGTLVILAAGVLAFLIVQDGPTRTFARKSKSSENCVQLTPAQQLVKLINDDIDQLRKEGKLPKQWEAIATIEYKIRSDLARTLLGSEKLTLQRVKEGNHYLEVEVLDLPDDKDPGIILQMSLKEIKSKNKIFEVGRTYLMSTLNRQVPPTEGQNTQGSPTATQQPAAAQPQSGSTQAVAPPTQAAPVQQTTPAQQNGSPTQPAK
ncbi:hypothetical protein [Bdellovibrio sp. HCB209]|uniref:hypothetical protein n=1 Tax=Bdellovibrio sp. HCB209 TaxID=3394354 RepID=UPI0039B59428